jgi:hypothetical protein
MTSFKRLADYLLGKLFRAPEPPEVRKPLHPASKRGGTLVYFPGEWLDGLSSSKHMLMTFSYGDLTNQEFLLRLLRELPLRSESACWMIVTPVPHKAEKADLDSSNDIIAKRIRDHILLTPGSKSDCPINAYLQFIDFYMIFGVALIFGWEPSDSLPVDKEDGDPEYFGKFVSHCRLGWLSDDRHGQEVWGLARWN